MFNSLGTIFSDAHLGDYQYLQPIVNFLDGIIIPFTIVMAVAAALMTIVLAVMIAKAEDGDKAREMKKRLWGLMITFVIVVVLIWGLGYLLSYFGVIMGFIRGLFS